jgi:hypothetical protein
LKAVRIVGWGAPLVLLVLSLALAGASADAQTPEYDIPTPTPTPTPSATPTPTATATPTPTPSAPRMMRPFPRVRTAGSYTRFSTTISRLTVQAPAGARIQVSCTKRRCRYSLTARSARVVRVWRQPRSFPAGTVMEIRVTAPAVIGKYVRIRMRAAQPPLRRDLCLRPGRRAPVACAAT